MLRPKRAKKKTSDGVIKTSLSKPADGSALRRRYALAGAGFVVMLIAVIVVLVTKGGKSDPADTSFDIEVDMSKFEELHDYDLPNQKLKAKIYKHKKSDLQVMAVYPEDTSGDAVFGLNIRTVPHNNHGTPHVLQRAVFNGSQKYPVKDPFNQLKHGSLQSYIDAWTGRDRSAFVVASRNLKDFRNSIDVFLDSVFNPRVIDQKEASWIFRQEAWRVEVEVEGDQQKAVLNG
jgi:Zn-dependent M16 (insulinase) family peptidase